MTPQVPLPQPGCTVVGVLLNDPAALDDAVHQPPYKSPPRAPVLYLKQRNTWATPGAAVEVPAEPGPFELGATLGLMIGRTACRVAPGRALDHLAGVTLVADRSVPHDSLYHPSVRSMARDGSCLIGPEVFTGIEADALQIEVFVDGVARGDVFPARAAQATTSCPATRARPFGGGCGSSPRWVRIFSMTGRSRMAAMIFTRRRGSGCRACRCQ